MAGILYPLENTMKLQRAIVITAGLLLLILAFAPRIEYCQAAENESVIKLFNGKDLDGWVPYLVEKGADPAATWSVKEGILRCTGKPNGYIKTAKSYKNYYLTVEWRWPEKPGNSGVLMHIQGDDKTWPLCIEAQLMAGSAGDFWFMDGATGNTDKARVNAQRSNNTRKLTAAENQPGEWNRYQIVSLNGTLTVLINGQLVNWTTDHKPSEGLIALQSEGAPIEFRTVELTPIP